MSGASRVQRASDYFHLSTQSPCMNFRFDPEDPGYEGRWHREWTEEASAWLDRVLPILLQRFEMLVAQPDPELPLVAYDERFPVWSPYRNPEAPPPWRIEFVGMGGAGMTQVTVAFSRLPGPEARERLRQELIKDVALLDREGRRS